MQSNQLTTTLKPDSLHPPYHTHFIDLNLCRLHVMKAGSGPPLVLAPATISELENWVSLTQFLAQWFTVYFFELPGHGQSQAFKEQYSTEKVAEMVEQLVDAIGAERFNLMGFSFGGIIAMRIFERLHARIERLILISPCLTHRALPLTSRRKALLCSLVRFISRSGPRALFLDLVHSRSTVLLVIAALRYLGHLEDTVVLKEKFLTLQGVTLDVLTEQMLEALTLEMQMPVQKYVTPCYFAMSWRDPLLDFETTLAVARGGFEHIHLTRLDYPYHQPPRPLTFDELNRDFKLTMDMFFSSQINYPLPTQVRPGQSEI